MNTSDGGKDSLYRTGDLGIEIDEGFYRLVGGAMIK
jgi:hypothetical protein